MPKIQGLAAIYQREGNYCRVQEIILSLWAVHPQAGLHLSLHGLTQIVVNLSIIINMPIVTYDQRTNTSAQLTGRYNPVDQNNALAQGVSDLGRGLESFANQRIAQKEKQDDELANLWIQGSGVEQRLDKLYNDTLNTAPEGGVGLQQEFGKQFLTFKNETLRNAPNDAARKKMESYLTKVGVNYEQKTIAEENRQNTMWKERQYEKGSESFSTLVRNLPTEELEGRTTDWLNTFTRDADTLDVPPDVRERIKEKGRKDVANAANITLADRDAEAYLRAVNPPPSTFDDAVKKIFKTEGGYVANDAGKGETNLGINTTANPEVDIKNLTPEKASVIYKEKYWDAINADSLPENMRMAAFDAAVNQGVGFTQKALKEAGGDVGKFLELRRERYAAIIKNDPSKKQYAKAWENRVGEIEQSLKGSGVFQLGDFNQQQAWLQYAEGQARQQKVEYASALTQQLQNISALSQDGKKPDVIPEFGDLVKAFGVDKAQEKFAKMQYELEYATAIPQFIKMNSDDIITQVGAMQPDVNDPYYADKAPVFRATQAAAQKILEDREKNPVEAMKASGFIQQNIEWNPQDMEATSASIANRVAEAETASTALGTRSAYFDKTEKKALEEMMKPLTSTQKLDFFSGLYKTIGGDAGSYVKVLSEMGQNDPILASAGELATRYNNPEAAKTILDGQSIMALPEKQRPPLPSPDTINTAFNTAYLANKLDVFDGTGETYEQYRSIFESYIVGSLRGKNVELDDKNRPIIPDDLAAKAVKELFPPVLTLSAGNAMGIYGVNPDETEDALSTGYKKWVEANIPEGGQAYAFEALQWSKIPPHLAGGREGLYRAVPASGLRGYENLEIIVDADVNFAIPYQGTIKPQQKNISVNPVAIQGSAGGNPAQPQQDVASNQIQPSS